MSEAPFTKATEADKFAAKMQCTCPLELQECEEMLNVCKLLRHEIHNELAAVENAIEIMECKIQRYELESV